MKVLFYYNGGEHLGVEALSAYLKSKGHTVDLIFDPGYENNFFFRFPYLNNACTDEMLIRKAVSFSPDIVAFSCVTNLFPVIKNMAGKLKQELRVPTIIGGIHPTTLPEEVIKEDCFDFLCIGEGEEAFAELLERMENNEDLTSIRNIWLRDENGVVHRNPLRPPIRDLDTLPFPDKPLFGRYGMGMLNSRTKIMTSRGCPFQCTFCVNSIWKGLYPDEVFLRRRSVAHVIEELRLLKEKHKPRAFRFEDNVFAVNLNWLKEFREQYSEVIGLPFHCYLTPSTAGNEVLSELKAAGCVSVSMGVQSGNGEIRKSLLNRKHSDEDIIQAAERIRKHDIRLHTEFIFGFPMETPADMWSSLELNEKLHAHNTISFVFYPFPGTKLAEFCLRNGHLTEQNYNLVKQGHGSVHLSCLLDHPFRDEAMRFHSILPLYNRAPGILKFVLKKLLGMKYGLLHKIVFIFSIPFADLEEFLIRLAEVPRVIIRTRRELSRM